MIWSQDKYVRALDFATVAHSSQKVPGTSDPYILHVVKVAMEVMSAFPYNPNKDFDLAVQCALLHDTIEDTSVTYNDICRTFGQDVADGVLALTKKKNIPTKALQMSDSLERILLQPPGIAMVKLGDRITNLSKPPGYWDNEKKKSYLKEAELIMKKLGHVSEFLNDRIKARIDAYEKFIN